MSGSRIGFTLAAAAAAGLVLVIAEPALAGPGGQIARTVLESFWGRLALVVLTIVFAPIIILLMMRERRAELRARRDLAFVARTAPAFEWMPLRERAIECFNRIHSAWSREDVSEAGEWMTDWYWQNQQQVHLDRWAEQGLVNHCTVRRIRSVRPLVLVHRNDGGEHEGSRVVIAISARMRDYLARRDTDEVVEGSRRYKDVETLWSFVLEARRWRVSNIEPSDTVEEYLAMLKTLPPVEETMASPPATTT